LLLAVLIRAHKHVEFVADTVQGGLGFHEKDCYVKENVVAGVDRCGLSSFSQWRQTISRDAHVPGFHPHSD
jgi:hypothetical protein